MNITQSKIDELNAVLTVNIDKSDYQETVENALKNYRKNANVPGFRKGNVPMSLIKKQYEKPLIYDEVNKILQKSIDDYLNENKINTLGNPLPKADNEFDWDKNPLTFEFELGIAPDFEVDLSKISVDDYQIKVGEEDIQKYVQNFRQRFGKMSDAKKSSENSVLKGVFHVVDEEGNTSDEHYHSTILLERLKDSAAFQGKKVDDKVTVHSDEIFENASDLAQILGIESEEANGFSKKLQYKINQITELEPAEINQELFDKVYGEGAVTTEEEFTNKIKEEAEKMYVRETDRYLLNEVLENLIEGNKFDLPKEFLLKWIQFSNKEANSEEKALELYNQSEKGLRVQMIESKIAEKFDLKVSQEDMLDQAVKMIKQQMAMYGPLKMDDEQLKNIAMGALQNQQEAQKLADEVFINKIIHTFKENVKLNKKEVSFEEFVDLVNKEKVEA